MAAAADVVFDPVGGEVFENSVGCIAWGARGCWCGFYRRHRA